MERETQWGEEMSDPRCAPSRGAKAREAQIRPKRREVQLHTNAALIGRGDHALQVMTPRDQIGVTCMLLQVRVIHLINEVCEKKINLQSVAIFYNVEKQRV